jgi:hypothetical protein
VELKAEMKAYPPDDVNESKQMVHARAF